MDFQTLRNSIPALERATYLNTGAGGPSPRQVVAATTAALEAHEYDAPADEGMYAAVGAQYDATKAALADLLGCRTQELALTQSTTDAINRVAGAFEWDAGDTIVRTDLEHPAGILPWERLERTRGVEVQVLETEAGRVDLETLAETVADARLLVVSSITWTHGTRVPIPDIVEIAHEADTLVLVDAVQSPGQTPIDVTEWGADFVVGAGHKWLLGHFGAGFLYVREGVERECLPSAIGFRSVEAPYAPSYEYAAGAKRFEVGTTNPAPYAGLEAAISLYQELGPDRVESRIAELTDALKAGVPDDALLSPREYESGLVSIDVDDPEATVERLAREDIVVRSLPYPDAIRVSVHAFNTHEDVDALLEVLYPGQFTGSTRTPRS